MWGAHLLAVVCVAAAAALGFWQYDAWQAHREAERLDLTEAEPVPLTDVIGPDEPFPGADVGRPVRFDGTWLPAGSVLVSGRDDADGQPGLWVVTPLTVGGPDDPAVPVVRGWVPKGTDLDAVPSPQGEAEVVGWLQPPEGTGAYDDDPTDDVLPQLRIADVIQRIDQDMYGAYLVLDHDATDDPAAATDGLEAATLDQLPEAGRFTGWRNLAYAVEWWLFAGFAAFLWWRHVRDLAGEAAEPDVEEHPIGSGS